jgi:hypothetical protein
MLDRGAQLEQIPDDIENLVARISNHEAVAPKVVEEMERGMSFADLVYRTCFPSMPAFYSREGLDCCSCYTSDNYWHCYPLRRAPAHEDRRRGGERLQNYVAMCKIEDERRSQNTLGLSARILVRVCDRTKYRSSVLPRRAFRYLLRL